MVSPPHVPAQKNSDPPVQGEVSLLAGQCQAHLVALACVLTWADFRTVKDNEMRYGDSS
jgi:hypothetical protein